MREALRRIVEGRTTRAARIFDLVSQALVVVTIVAFSIESLPDLSDADRALLDRLETVTVAVFTIEYLLRVFVAERPLRYVFGFWGVVDAVAILPFYLSLGLNLQSIRALRLLRLFRLLKLTRYSLAARRFGRALRAVRDELVVFGSFTGVLLYLASVGIYYFEHEAQPDRYASIFDAMWWAVATLTTVGYGDTYPITAGGRAFTFLILILGLGVVSVPSGLLASALSQTRKPLEEDPPEG